jgi:hypothetical protein
MKLFLDANILFSASVPNSATRILFDAAAEFADELVTNPHTLEEARRNIESKRSEQYPEFRQIMKGVTVSNAFFTELLVDLPSQDIPVLAGAIGARCSHLWTSDKKHFGRFYGKTIQGVQIVSSIMLADILIDSGWSPEV